MVSETRDKDVHIEVPDEFPAFRSFQREVQKDGIVVKQEHEDSIPLEALALAEAMRSNRSPLRLTSEERICPSDDLLRQFVYDPTHLDTPVKVQIMRHGFGCEKCRRKEYRYLGEKRWGDPERGEQLFEETLNLKKDPFWKKVQEILDAEDKERIPH